MKTPTKADITRARSERAVPYYSDDELKALDFSDSQTEKARASRMHAVTSRQQRLCDVRSLIKQMPANHPSALKPMSKARFLAHKLRKIGYDVKDLTVWRDLKDLGL
jgi:hypothetical protein